MPSQKIKIFLGFVFFIHSVAWSAEGPGVKENRGIQNQINCDNPHPMIQRLCKREAELLDLQETINNMKLGEEIVLAATIGSLAYLVLQKITLKSSGTLVKNVNEILNSKVASESEKNALKDLVVKKFIIRKKKALQEVVTNDFKDRKKKVRVGQLMTVGSVASFLLMGYYKDSLIEELDYQIGLQTVELRNLELEILKSLEDGSLPEKFGPPQDKKSGKSPGATPEISTQPEDYI